MDALEWWLTKILALLHDPPWKPWVVCRKPGRVLATSTRGQLCINDYCVDERSINYLDGEVKSKRMRAHEADARALILLIAAALRRAGRDDAASVLEDAALNRDPERSWVWEVVEEADKLASTFDRWVVNYLVGGGHKSTRQDEVACRVFLERNVVVNTINPNIRYEPGSTRSGDDIVKLVECYVGRLLALVEEVARYCSSCSVDELLRRLYFILYLTIEPLWYYSGGKPPVADTRFPNHTVFDHAYATVQAVNMITTRGGIDGYIVLVDVPGVQRFVSAARRVRDLWIGSWLVSAIVYAAISKLISHLGPDIMIKPSPSLNPFVAYHLAVEAVGDALPADLQRVLALLGLECSSVSVASCWPRQPVMPGQVKLILPSNFLLTTLLTTLLGRGGTSSTSGNVSSIEDAIAHLIDSEVCEAWEKLAKEVVDVIEEYVKQGDLELPGFKLDDLKQILEEPPLRVVVRVERIGHYYEYLANTLKGQRTLSGSAGGAECMYKLLNEVTDLLGKVVKDEKLLDEIAKWAEKELGVDAKTLNLADKLALELARKFTYALIAKLPTRDDEPNVDELTPLVRSSDVVYQATRGAYDKARDKARRGASDSIWRHCSSCSAPLAARSKVSRAGLDERETLCPYCLAKRLIATKPRLLEEAVNSLLLRKPCGPARVVRLPVVLRTGDVATLYRRELYGSDCEGSVPPIIEEALRRVGWSTRRCEVEEAGEVAPRYLLVVKGDGDSMGRGVFVGALGVPYADYVERVAEATNVSLPGWMRTLLNGVEKAARVLLGVDKPLILVTPAYVMAASRALMATAVQDARIVEALGGVVVYAGGDDIAALLPAYAPGDGRRVVEAALKVLSDYGLSYAERLASIVAGAAGVDACAVYSWPGALVVALLRANYWGLLSEPLGFHTLSMPGWSGNPLVTPAVVAYGRSFGVIVMHYRDHLLTGYLSAADLEEAKDVVELRSLATASVLRKDLVVVGYGRLGYYLRRLAHLKPEATAVIRFHLERSDDAELGGGVDSAYCAVRAYGRLVRSAAGSCLSSVVCSAAVAPYLVVLGVLAAVEGEAASVSILHDAQLYAATANAAAARVRAVGLEAARALLRRVVSRNTSSPSADVWGACEKLVDYEVLVDGRVVDLLSFEAFNAAGKLYSARR